MNNGNNDKPHPAHEKLLNILPTDFHHLVIPVLKEWDKGVQDRFAEIHNEYEDLKPFKALADKGVDAAFVDQALQFVEAVQSNPQAVMDQINEAWDLGYISKDKAEELQSQYVDPNEDPSNYDNDNPKLKALETGLSQLQQTLTAKEQEEAEAKALQEFEEYLDTLEKETKENNLPFNRLFVTALISNGIDGEDAVKQYHEVLATQAVSTGTTEETTNETETPPVVLGGAVQGSGLPDGSVDFGKLSNREINDTVVQLLANQAESGQS